MSPIRPENRDRYPSDWPEVRRRILARATDLGIPRCECTGECGRDHGGRCPNWNGRRAHDTGSRVVLTTAHLDHAPENCEDDNLRAMCQGCHLRYDRDHHAETRAATARAAREAAGQVSLL